MPKENTYTLVARKKEIPSKANATRLVFSSTISKI